MTKILPTPTVAPVALTDDVAAMADYVRSAKGLEAIERGRVIAGANALAPALKRRAANRRVHTPKILA
jgi:hypothetical protein